ncbi:MAG: cytochrome P450, partial [Mycolicibacterium sp.]
MTGIREAVTAKARATIPLDRLIQGAHLYDKTRRWVTGTNGEKIFTER